MSTSAVTRLLSGLEQRLGVRLLERTTRQISLTEAGAELIVKARHLCTSYDELTHLVSRQAVHPQGHICFSAPLLFGEGYISPILFQFLEQYPSVSMDLALSDRVEDLIGEGIDMALRIGNMRDSSLISRRVGWLRQLCVASPAYLKKKGQPQRPEDLCNHDCISIGGQRQWAFQEDKTSRKIRIKARFGVSIAQPAIEAALRGKGIASVLSYQVKKYLSARKLERILGGFEMPSIPVHLVYPSSKLQPKRVRLLFDFLVQHLSQLPDLHP